MFIGARAAVVSGGTMRAGVVVEMPNPNRYRFKRDDEVVVDVFPKQLQLINNWKTYKKLKDVGDFKIFPDNNIDPRNIFMSKKPIIFGVGGMRSVWYWANHMIFDGKLTEPVFKPITSRKRHGFYINHSISVSNRNNSFIQFTTVMVHEMVHQMNLEVEHIPYKLEGVHGKSFRRWIPIIKEKTGLKITQFTVQEDDVTEFDEDSTKGEPTVDKSFIFMLFKIGATWWGLQVDNRVNLPMVTGEVNSLLRAQNSDSKIYAGKSNFKRVQQALIMSKNGSVPRQIKFPFPLSLVNLLAKTCTPISGYRIPEEIELKN